MRDLCGPAFSVLTRTDPLPVLRDSADEPRAIPQFPVADLLYLYAVGAHAECAFLYGAGR